MTREEKLQKALELMDHPVNASLDDDLWGLAIKGLLEEKIDYGLDELLRWLAINTPEEGLYGREEK